MRISAALLISTSAFVFTAPALAQTAAEGAAQAANQPAAMQEGQGEIIVTATKRASTVQDVPFSINAQTQADIERAHAQTLEDIARNVAGLTVQNLGPGQSQVSVRGVSAGQIARDQPGVKEQVGVYLDESVTALSLFTPDFDLYDLNRVETLRGPQGTLFGSGSVGGTLRYITNQPRLDYTEGSAEGDVNFLKDGGVGYGLKGAINLPLGAYGRNSRCRLRHALRRLHRFGRAVRQEQRQQRKPHRRTGLDPVAADCRSSRSRRASSTSRCEAGGFNREDHYIIFDNQFTTQNDLGKREQYLLFREEFRDKTLLGDLVASYDFGPAELTSVTSYINRDILVSRDASALTDSVFVSFGGQFLNATLTRSTRKTNGCRSGTLAAMSMPPTRRTSAIRPSSSSSRRS